MINPHTGREFAKDYFKDAAKGKPCLIRIVRTCLGESCASDETTVLCHFTMPGYKAIGSREASLPDLCGAWGCRTCHDICDGRIQAWRDIGITSREIQFWHAEGVMRTLDALVKAGVLPNP